MNGFVVRSAFYEATRATHVPEQIMSGTSKNVGIRSVSYVEAWFRTDGVEECVTVNRRVAKCRLYLGRGMPSFFIRASRAVRLIPSRAVRLVGPPMIQFVSQDPQFQKDYLKLVDEE